MSTFPDIWRKNKDFGKIDYILALYHIYPTAVKGIKNELLSGRQKFVFWWRRQRDSNPVGLPPNGFQDRSSNVPLVSIMGIFSAVQFPKKSSGTRLFELF